MGGKVTVVDYGSGNLHSVAKALERVGASHVEVSADPAAIRSAERIVFPGVGALGDCMAELRRRELDTAITDAVAAGIPLLGVCVGMQALFEHGEESGGTAGLGLLPGQVRAFPENLQDLTTGQRLKVPHMGWNEVHQVIEHPLFAGIPQDARFYFVHSYYAEPAGPDPIAAFTLYPYPVTAAVAAENVFGVQFHPEKSQEHGLTLFANFLTWDGRP
ncbi:glutamine amidotransferase [Thiohalospira halophila DSM 15071]|uniref:Imidazole glycerol phosphate synthase subunit HisH n=1 Tax=Thiohalospira halophila DSM 15071 TaxID=1123397 RepID=A0A1I1TE86_9GAMM|nr:imidazole glycerol phosphate synthase subunit HisH [Thiohalospira halophila]SFD56941.1 glutamine amidotransferase [Thiohalospira halophila DSM 15071]